MARIGSTTVSRPEPQFLESEGDAKTETRVNYGLLMRFKSRGVRAVRSNREAGGYRPLAGLR